MVGFFVIVAMMVAGFIFALISSTTNRQTKAVVTAFACLAVIAVAFYLVVIAASQRGLAVPIALLCASVPVAAYQLVMRSGQVSIEKLAHEASAAVGGKHVAHAPHEEHVVKHPKPKHKTEPARKKAEPAKAVVRNEPAPKPPKKKPVVVSEQPTFVPIPETAFRSKQKKASKRNEAFVAREGLHDLQSDLQAAPAVAPSDPIIIETVVEREPVVAPSPVVLVEAEPAAPSPVEAKVEVVVAGDPVVVELEPELASDQSVELEASVPKSVELEPESAPAKPEPELFADAKPKAVVEDGPVVSEGESGIDIAGVDPVEPNSVVEADHESVVVETAPEPVAAPKPVAVPEPAVVAMSEPVVEAVPEPVAVSEPAAEAAPAPAAASESVVVPKSVAAPQPVVVAAPEPAPAPEPVTEPESAVEAAPAPTRFDPKSYYDKATLLRDRGLFAVAAKLYEECAYEALSQTKPDFDAHRRALMEQLACYVKAGMDVEARALASELKEKYGNLSLSERVRIEAVLRESK